MALLSRFTLSLILTFVFVVLTSKTVLGSEISHEGHSAHSQVRHPKQAEHQKLKQEFNNAKKDIDDKYIDCDPHLKELLEKADSAVKSHKHAEATEAIEEIKKYKPPTSDAKLSCPSTVGNGKDSEHAGNNASQLGSVSTFLTLIFSGLLAFFVIV